MENKKIIENKSRFSLKSLVFVLIHAIMVFLIVTFYFYYSTRGKIQSTNKKLNEKLNEIEKNIDECHEINQKQFDKIIEKLDKLIKDKDSSKPSPKGKISQPIEPAPANSTPVVPANTTPIESTPANSTPQTK